MILYLGHGAGVDQRSQRCPGFKPIANFHFPNGRSKFFGKNIIDTSLYIDPVGTDAGLTIVAKLTQDCTFDSGIDVGVIKHDERRIAAQFH